MKSYYYSWSVQSEVLDFPLESSAGPYLRSSGKQILDCISSSFQAHFGHSHPALIDAMMQQVQKFSIASPKARFDLKQEASQKLLDLLGLEGCIFYTVSGAESVENALKIARQIRSANKILARQKSYHGASLGALSVTGDWRSHNHFGLHQYTIRIPEPSDDPDLSILKKLVEQEGADSIAAICIETISGTNGVHGGNTQWWQNLRHFCDDTGILLIVDEVLVGFGRCEQSFAFQRYNIKPDMVCMSKGISGGYIPFGAVFTNTFIAEYYANRILSAGLTNYAHPLGLACMNAVIDILNDAQFIEHKRQLETQFSEGIGRLNGLDQIESVRQYGLLAALDTSRHDLSWKDFWNLGIYVYINQGMIVLAPPFILTRAQLEAMFECIEMGLKSS